MLPLYCRYENILYNDLGLSASAMARDRQDSVCDGPARTICRSPPARSNPILRAGTCQGHRRRADRLSRRRCCRRSSRPSRPAHPDIEVELVWKQGREAFDDLAKPDQSGVDVFWAPSLDNFPALREQGAFRTVTVDRAAIPGRIGRQPISDPAGYYEAYEVAGYGLAVNAGRLQGARTGRAEGVARRRRPPLRRPGRPAGAERRRLRAGALRHHPAVGGLGGGLGADRRDRRQWPAAGAPAAARAMRSPTAKSRSASPSTSIPWPPRPTAGPVGFVYPARTAFLPAHLAVTASAPHASDRGGVRRLPAVAAGPGDAAQPDIRRHPIRPDAYGEAPAAFGNPFTPADDITFAYDGELGRLRRGVIGLAVRRRHRQPARSASRRCGAPSTPPKPSWPPSRTRARRTARRGAAARRRRAGQRRGGRRPRAARQHQGHPGRRSPEMLDGPGDRRRARAQALATGAAHRGGELGEAASATTEFHATARHLAGDRPRASSRRAGQTGFRPQRRDQQGLVTCV